MNEELMKLLSSLEDENLALSDKLSQKKKELAALRDFHLDYSPAFPLSAQELMKINQNLAPLDAPIGKLEEAKGEVVAAREAIYNIASFISAFRYGLAQIKNLDEKGLYDSALIALNDLDAKAGEKELEAMKFIPLAKEILAYEKCALLAHKAEANIAKGVFPMDKDELYAFHEFALSLTCLANPESLRNYYVDESLGLIYYLATRSAKAKVPSVESFKDLQEAMTIAEENKEGRLALTEERANALRAIYAEQFNGLSYEYFENEANYDKALEIYRGRNLLMANEIDHYAYKESEEEREFYLAFIKSNCLKKSPSAYNDTVLIYGQKAAAGDEDSFIILANILSLPLLDAAKFNMALRATAKFDFVQMLRFLEQVVRLGIDREKASLVFDDLCKRKKEGDLEAMAPSINYLNFHIDPSIREEFNSLRLSLLRSNRSHKIKIKSTDENLHMIFGEEKGTYPVPAGKKMKSNYVKAWSLGTLFIYWLFMAVLPVSLAIFLGLAMFNNHWEKDFTTFIYIAPFAIVYLFTLIIGLQWLSNDEWESSVFRRALLIISSLLGVIPLLYFILPNVFPFFEMWSLPLFVVAGVTGFLDILIIRERKKLLGYLTTLPFILIILACAVFLVLQGLGIQLS